MTDEKKNVVDSTEDVSVENNRGLSVDSHTQINYANWGLSSDRKPVCIDYPNYDEGEGGDGDEKETHQ